MPIAFASFIVVIAQQQNPLKTMANTYSQIYLHTIFAVKFRNALISNDWKSTFQGVIGQLINETGCKTYIVNGMPDHIHCLFGLLPRISVSDVMKTVKAKSSKYVNETGLTRHRFEWQGGYCALSYSKASVKTIFNYIKEQELHHRNTTFLQEYVQLLNDLKIPYENKYLFTDPV